MGDDKSRLFTHPRPHDLAWHLYLPIIARTLTKFISQFAPFFPFPLIVQLVPRGSRRILAQASRGRQPTMTGLPSYREHGDV